MKHLLSRLGVFCVLTGAAFAQPPSAARPAFTVADVHESPHMTVHYATGGQLLGDRYILRQYTMVDLVALAYGIKPEMVQGGPSWLEMKRFDVIAKADPKSTDPSLKLMVQSLLSDRFHLTMHKGEVTMPAYLLTAANGKTKMTPSSEERENCKPDPTPQAEGAVPFLAVRCTAMTVDDIAMFISQVGATSLTEPVLNQTGLDGKYDFALRWTDFRQRARAESDFISIFDAVEKDLGLKLTLKTGPRTVWIVDTVEDKPTPNSPNIAKELPAPPPAEFEVATVKPSRPGDPRRESVFGGQVNFTGTTLRRFIDVAWLLSPLDPQMIANAPAWLDSDRFDIIAKATMPAAIPGRPPLQLDDTELRQMMQNLLADRFHMKAHMEEQPIFAWKMVVDHPKLKEADPKTRTHCKDGPGPDGKDPRQANPMLTALWTCYNITMMQLGGELAHYATGYIYTPILDATGLKGSYDLTLAWSSASLTILAPPPPVPAQQSGGQQEASTPGGAVTLYDAMQKQLGIRMVREKRPVPVLVIDHIEETPTPN